jgi:hypothetical protein
MNKNLHYFLGAKITYFIGYNEPDNELIQDDENVIENETVENEMFQSANESTNENEICEDEIVDINSLKDPQVEVESYHIQDETDNDRSDEGNVEVCEDEYDSKYFNTLKTFFGS